MDISKSIRICLAEQDKNKTWLANQLGVSGTRVSLLLKQDNMESKVIKRLADAFGLQVSAFIAKGETK